MQCTEFFSFSDFYLFQSSYICLFINCTFFNSNQDLPCFQTGIYRKLCFTKICQILWVLKFST